MSKNRLISFLLAFIMAAGLFQTGFGLRGEEEAPLTERVFVTYENLEVTESFVTGLEGTGASYLSSGSKIQVVGPDKSVLGTRSLAVNNCDMRWWTLDARDQEMYVDIAVKADSNFHNSLRVNITTAVPSKDGTKMSGGDIIQITKKDDKTVVLDCAGNVVLELEEDVRYNIRTVFIRGSKEYKIIINSRVVSKQSTFVAPVYVVDSMSIAIEALPNVPSGIETPYLLIDNPSVYTKGRIYPQKFSAQAPGALPEISVPKAEKNEEIRVYMNTTQIAMSKAPMIKDGTLYVDAEQIMRCIGMELKEDKSNKSFTVTNSNVAVKAAIDSTSITINEKEYTLTAPPRKIEGVIMASPNFFNEVLNAKVWWDEAGKMLVITTGDYKKDGILRNVGGKFYMNGEPYYEISFNKFDLFYQVMSDYVKDASYPNASYTYAAAEEALKQLSELGFRSIRVFMYSGAYQDLMYNEEHQKNYFEAMDKLYDLCDKYNIKVVVCLGLVETFLLKNDYAEGEGWIASDETLMELVKDRNSESRKNVYQYLEMYINRYKDRDTVLMWEIRNEALLEADVGEAVNVVKYSLLQRAEFYGDCADKIRELDPHRLITSGDSVLRNSQWNLFADIMAGSHLSWKTDTKEDRLKALALLNEKLDVISVHAYGVGEGSDVSVYLEGEDKTKSCTFDLYMEEAARLGKILYNGETNASGNLEDPNFYKITTDYLDTIINSGVQLSHWWTFRSDRQGFNDGYLWRVDGGELLDLIVAKNKELQAKYVTNKAVTDNTNDVWDDPMFQVFDETKTVDGSEFVAKASFRSKMIRLSILCSVILVAGGIGVFVLTREKLKKKRNKEIV